MQPEDQLTLGYVRSHPLEAARRLESMKSEDAAGLLAPLPADDVASVLEHCLPGPASRILANLTLRMTCNVITELSTSSAIGVLRQFDESLRMDLLERLEKAIGSSLRRAMRYPPHTAANLADPRVMTLPPDITIQEALARTKQDARNTTYYVYVIDREAKLKGLITLKQLIANDGDHLIATLMTTKVVTLSADASIDEILQSPQWERFHTLPVVDRWGAFLGALRYRTLRGIEQEHVQNPDPGPLSQALIQLWEVYSLAGIGIMTDMVKTMGSREPDRYGTSIWHQKENP
ncbi:MAG: CBS domain-containing protein [Nitrospirales bacterium]|nr:magnesium transporter [Nitrospira sp.]MDR4499889.1 CBS domain-containing protein [Nitrospirales bacterium]